MLISPPCLSFYFFTHSSFIPSLPLLLPPSSPSPPSSPGFFSFCFSLSSSLPHSYQQSLKWHSFRFDGLENSSLFENGDRWWRESALCQNLGLIIFLQNGSRGSSLESCPWVWQIFRVKRALFFLQMCVCVRMCFWAVPFCQLHWSSKGTGWMQQFIYTGLLK